MKGRRELRFGLLGPLVLYDRPTYETPYDAVPATPGHATPGHAAPHHPVPGEGTPDTAARAIGSPKVRALLAALLLEPGRVVSVESLKDALWGGAPPASAQASLHNHVTRLRRLLDDPERLRSVPPGYLLRVDQGERDVDVFDALVTDARAAHARQDWPGVVRSCTKALALWRGTPFSGLPDLGGHTLVPRLEEARLILLKWRYDAELALGGTRLAALVPELSALVAEHPFREAYHRQLMLALHRTGRQAEALAVHRDLRARLIEELGVEPGPAMREAHVEVLRGSDGSDAWLPEGEDAGEGGVGGESCRPTEAARPAGERNRTEHPPARGGDGDLKPVASEVARADEREGEGGGEREGGRDGEREGEPDGATLAAHPPFPAQLPPPPAHFTGRTPLHRALRHALTEPPAPGPAVAVVSGMAGVGKSALALHVAHELRERFPDGQLYVNLHGATPGMPPLAPVRALASLLRDLGVEPRNVPEHPDAAAALLRSLLAPARMLLVLDDAADAAQVRPLLPAGPGCAVIVTSRSPLTTLDGARRFPLTPLTGEDSATLLRALSGRPGLDAGHALVELTGGLPLALRVVAARLVARHALTPDVLAGQLAATGGRLRQLEYDDLSVRRSLAVAHDALAAADREADRDAALVLRRVGALDLPTYGAPLLARLTGIDARRAEAALDRLVDVALLEETAYGRYAPHDLVREFARELASKEEEVLTTADPSPVDRAATCPRTDVHPDLVALRWYAAVAERALVAIVEPGLDLDDRLRPTPAQPPEHAADVAGLRSFESAGQAFAWGETELENVVALVARNADAEDPRRLAHLSVLTRLLFPYAQRSGRVAEMEVLGRAALGAARRLDDEEARAYALGDLAGLHFLTGRHKDALALTDRCLESWRRLGVASRIRRCLNNRGLLLEGLGRFAESEEALRQSLSYARLLNDPVGEAVTHSHLGNLYEHTDPRAAIEQHRRSLAIGETVGAVIVRHSAHCNIGYAHLTLGEPAAAARHFEQSLSILGGHGDWHGESQTRLGLVRALRELGEGERAYIECGELLRRADARADRYTGGLARHQHGLLLHAQGRHREARTAWHTALTALTGTDEQTVLTELRHLLSE